MTNQALEILDNQVLIRNIRDLLEVSTVLVKSGLLPKAIDTAEKASVIILKGRELGIPMMASFSLINVIDRVPTVSPQGMLALINSRGVVEDLKIEGDDKQCTVTMKRRGQSAHTEVFTWSQAQKMATAEWKDGQRTTIPLTEKYNWRQMPKFMLQWRCVAACARIVYPDIVGGLYPPEEIDPGLVVNEEGEVVEGQVVEAQKHATVDQEMQQAQARAASEMAGRVQGASLEQVQANMEFVQGVLTYRHNAAGKAEVNVNGVWKEAGKLVGKLTDGALARFHDLFKDEKGKFNEFELSGHLKKHFKKGTVPALTWEEAAALLEWKKNERADPKWYADKIAKEPTEPLDAVAQSIAQVFELGAEVDADFLEFVGAIRSLKDPSQLSSLALSLRTHGVAWETHKDEMRALANLLAEGTVEFGTDEFNQMLASLEQAHAETTAS